MGKITEGERNSQLFNRARELFSKKLPAPLVELEIQRINSQECDPPLPSSEIDALVSSASRLSFSNESSIIQKLKDICKDVHFYHNCDKEAFAAFSIKKTDLTNENKSSVRVESSSFSDFLRNRYYKREGKSLSQTKLKEACELFRAEAIFDGEEEALYIRWAGLKDKVYCDISRDNQVVEISPGKVDISTLPL